MQMKSVRKKFPKKAYCIAGVIVAVLIFLGVLLHFFPVWRIVHIGPMTMGNYYTSKQIGMALSIGSASDRREAHTVQ